MKISTERVNPMMQKSIIIGLLATSLFMVGCGPKDRKAATVPAGVSQAGVQYIPTAEAGVDLTDPTGSTLETVQQIADRRYWASRGNPFSLLASERTFDEQQMLERVLSEGNGFSVMFEEPEDRSAQDIPRVEPRPAWRLSGIVISEGAVMALLDRGTSVDLIRPGSQVPGTEWVCVAIDSQRAILRRDGNVQPNEIVVNLEGPVFGGAGGGAGAGAGQPAAGGNAGGGGRGARGDLGGDDGGRDGR